LAAHGRSQAYRARRGRARSDLVVNSKLVRKVRAGCDEGSVLESKVQPQRDDEPL